MRSLVVPLLAAFFLAMPSDGQETVQIVNATALSGPARHGLAKLQEAILATGREAKIVNNASTTDGTHTILAGLASDPDVAKLLADQNIKIPTAPQALAICRYPKGNNETVVLCGADEVGLMYAALDTAERIQWSEGDEDVFKHIHNIAEAPYLTDRSVSTYTMHRGLFEQRLYDESYWEAFFDLLAKDRINSYVIIFGYENGGFMAPIYPYFFDVEGFPEVKFYGLSDAQQAKNTAALRRVIQLAHERGIRILPGIWDHIYRGGVQGGGIEGASQLAGKRAPHLVSGVTTENLADYTKAALAKFLDVFPDIDGIQFRMHWESGLTREETPGFWHDVMSMLSKTKPDIQLDLRAKGLPDVVIDDAVAQGLNFRIGTKYWMEQLGMPFHPTHVNPKNQKDRRHGYADLLRYPKRYEMHWRIWSGGTSRFLLWGDPEFVRRIVQTARVYDGRSFEVNEMLATKMLGSPHDEQPFELLNPAYRHYDYEFERYWHYYQVWGRVSYNPNTSAELWEREFIRRFGDQAGPALMESLHVASNILPRIVAASYNYRYFPTTRGWAEMMRMGDLPQYAQGTGTDVEQFQSYADAATQMLSDSFSAKCTPLQTSQWFSRTADRIERRVQDAQAASGSLDGPSAREFTATTTDLNILANLARYHSSRMKAAVWYNVYLQTEDDFALSETIREETQAIAHWKDIIQAAGDVYPETLKFGVHRVGFSWHWKEELVQLDEGLERLRNLPSKAAIEEAARSRLARRMQELPRAAFAIRLAGASIASAGDDYEIKAVVEPDVDLQSISLRYRHLTQFEDYASIAMQKEAATGSYTAAIPGDFISKEWNLMYFVEAIDKDGGGGMWPDFEREMPYVIVPVRR